MIDVSSAARVIETQFPALAPAAVTYLGQGYDSVAFDVNGRWVFRFPMREEVEAQLLVEWRILPQLATQSFTGAIDWSEIAIGDPAIDLLRFTPEAVRRR